ncbi:MAG: hypothetical protein Q8R53_00050, partial [Nanoarchaeota archaeon]|nr:hypothetical protein [Nanoarchaeota archaeon]
MQALLVRRDPVSLVEQEGTVTMVRELPDFLRQQPLAIHHFYYDWQTDWRDDELWLDKRVNLADDLTRCYSSIPEKPVGGIPALWSGYRSCVTLDEKTNQLYRLKGV